jgi:hypothetical protein
LSLSPCAFRVNGLEMINSVITISLTWFFMVYIFCTSIIY